MRQSIPHGLIRTIFCLLLGGLILASCSYQSVRHLKRQPWTLNTTRTLEMKYLNFQYKCKQFGSQLRVFGTALPKDKSIPQWACWTREIWLGAYLSDQDAKVIAKKILILPPQRFDPAHGFPFQMTLQPHDMGSPGPLFITFGYRLVLTDHSSDATSQEQDKTCPSKEHVFFASESALTKF